MSPAPSLSARLRRATGLVLATAAAGAALPAGASAATLADFYVPPSPLPAGEPGDVIRAERVSYTKSWMRPPRGTRQWRVLYQSTSALGKPIAVSGSILTSGRFGTPAAKRPLVAYALGSQGTGDKCAPSRKLQWGGVQDFIIVNMLLDRGYNVAVSDYEGLGTPGVHTYAVNRSAAQTVLDMVRAARNLPEAGIDAAAPTAVYGYSQGGGAAGATAEFQPDYAPDVPLKGVVAGGVIADPYLAGLSLNGSEYAGYLFAAALGYDEAYPELNLDQYLNDRGRTERVAAFENCFDDVLNKYKGSQIIDFTTSNPMEQPDWRSRLAENALGKSAPQTPVLMFHSTKDEILPYAATAALRRTWCSQGAQLDFKTIYGVKHFHGAILGVLPGLKFLDDRFRGRSFKGNCPR